MPGGAPLKRAASKRACKYGPRDADGYCPKKPASSSTSKPPRAPRAKPPCKYGPRDASGYCPKKPKAPKREKAPTVRDYSSPERAGKQVREILTSSKATKEQKREAVQVLGEAIAVESGKKVAEHIGRSAQKAVKDPKVRAQVIDAAKKAAPLAGAVARAGVVGLGIYATLALGKRALTSQRERESAAFANAELAKTQKKVSLTQDQAVTLWKQYFDFNMKRPVQNPFIGK